MKFFQKKIHTALGIGPRYQCTKFQKYLTTNNFTIALRSFLGNFWARKGSQSPKNQNFRKKIYTALETGPRYQCTKFEKYLTANDFTIALRRFTGQFWARKGPWGPKNQNFPKKIHTALGIGPRYQCTKFQKYLTTIDFTIAVRRFTGHFWARKGSQGPKNQNFHKIEYWPLRIGPSYKCAKFQKNLTTSDSTVPQNFYWTSQLDFTLTITKFFEFSQACHWLHHSYKGYL